MADVMQNLCGIRVVALDMFIIHHNNNQSVFIFSLLPIAGVAVAESVCTQKTVTTTAYETVYETAKPALVADATASQSGACSSRSTVFTTTYEKVYVTVPAGAATPDAVDETSTSTRTTDIYTTPSRHKRCV